MAKILITSKGCYAVENGKTIALESGSEFTVEDRQAEIFVKSGKAELIANVAGEAPVVEKAPVVKKSK